MSDLVSIVIPAYQAGRFIRRALESVLAQTHRDWEVIVVEDGTHDETEAVVSQFAATVSQSVRYENNGTNRGVSVTRNCGMALARGSVVAFLDADDRWSPEHLATGLETLEHGADLCFSGFYLFDESTQTAVPSPVPNEALFANPLSHLFESNFIQTSSLVMVRREWVERTGGFDADLRVGEDCDFWMRALALGARLACTGKLTCYYTKHGGSAMAKTLVVAEHAVKFYRKHLQSAFLPAAVRKNFYAKSLSIYGRLIGRQNPVLARTLFLEAWKMRPGDLRPLAYALRLSVIALFRT
ncbi:MAG: glycosyltransferase family A protein [Verrucomicrobia bacterium]|nr:glycosyltransferase family A protein [Verrucomicrobiota bacterium]